MKSKVYNNSGKILISTPELTGTNTAFESANLILVSPAIFQLLTDEEDIETRLTVADQVKVKPLSDLKVMVKRIIESELDKVFE